VTNDDLTNDDLTNDDLTNDDVTETKTETDEQSRDEATAPAELESSASESSASESTESESTELEDVAAESGDDQPPTEPRPPTLFRRLLVPVALAVLVLGSIGVATGSYLGLFRPDQQVSEAAKATALKAASEGTTSLLSYSPDTLDKDFATAKAHLTGDFLNYYTKFTTDIVTPAAKQKSVKTSAAVVQSAVSEMHPDSAVVLLFVNQATTSKENPDGSFTASSVKVGLTKVGDDWLISSFDPV
jgi:Mce-associated membrane protein